MSLHIVPCELDEANAFVEQHHRHSPPARIHRFSIAVVDEDGTVRGVAIVGNPKSRVLQDGWTLEVLRVATDGTRNACSKLYALCRRAAAVLGYRKIITYNLPTESVASLRASGFRCVAVVRGKTWHTPSRPRVDKAPKQGKLRWEATA